jgi:proteasome accessory factor A
MQQRLTGLETEFCVRYSAAPGKERPSNKQICEALLDALERVVKVAPGERDAEPDFQRFVQNGGAFSYDAYNSPSDGGPLESATPECRGPSQVLLYQKAQEALIQRALPLACARLAAAGWFGEIAVVKNCRDAEGHVYGTQENYEAEIARGWRLQAYRLGLAILTPSVLLALAVFWASVLLVLLITGGVLLIFPLAKHWVGLDWYSSSSPDSAPNVQLDAILSRMFWWVAFAVFSPPALAFLAILRTVAFRDIRETATAFLISRIVLTGGGTLHNDGSFGLSERAESVSRTIRCTLGRRKYVFETANLLKPLFLFFSSGCLNISPILALFSRRQRLHLGVSDSNCAQTAEYLKVGTTSLVLDMAEAGFLHDAPRLVRPVEALKCISNDPTLRAQVPLKNGAMTALDLQRWYLRRAEEFLAAQRVASLETRELVALWRSTLEALERNPSSLVGRLDWVTKRALMVGPRPLSAAARKKIDIKYHELGSGYLSLLEQRGIAPVRLLQADIDAAVLHPPNNTPAWKRGRLITNAGERRVDLRVSWRNVDKKTDRIARADEGKEHTSIRQRSEGPNSLNVVTFGPHSPVTITQGPQPWTLNSAQRHAVSAAVRPYSHLWDGQFDVIVCNIDDAESIRMAEAFVAAFRDGGWNLPHSGFGQAVTVPTPVGVSVTLPRAFEPAQMPAELHPFLKDFYPFLKDFSSALRGTGVIRDLLVLNANSSLPVGQFQICIGRRSD